MQLANGAIVIVAYRGGPLLERAVASCAEFAPEIPLILVDNSAGGVARAYADRAHVLPQASNLGFAGGANAGLTFGLERGAPYVLLLNEDAELHAGAWQALVAVLEAEPGAAAAQPAIMRPDGTVNSLGNPVHRLGFAWAGGDGALLAQAESDPALPWLRDGTWRASRVCIPTFSGAAVLLRAAALRQAGLFENRLISYYEDVELSLRLRRSGWTLWLTGQATVTHHHNFKGNPEKFRLLEKNRVWVLLAHLRVRTLLRLTPLLAGAELGVLVQAARQGWLLQKLAAYPHYVPTPRRLLRLLERRRDLKGLTGGPSDLALFESATWRLPPRTPPGPAGRTIRWSRSLRAHDTLVVVPARDAAAELGPFLERLRSELPATDIVVVDNGSTDATGDVAETAGARVLGVPFDIGVGGAVRLALRYAVLNGYERAVRADLGSSPAGARRLLDDLESGTDLVIGSRYLDGAAPPAGRFLALVLRFATGRRFTDASSGLRGFSRRMLEFFAAEHPTELLGDTAETILAAWAAGFKVSEVPVEKAEGQAAVPLGYNYARTLLALIAHSLPRRRHWSLPR